MAGKDIKATAKLFLDTSNAAKDAKQFFADLKRQLDSLEDASSKFGVFKELGTYLSEVDNKLTALRNKNEDAFNHMFDGLDENLRTEMEGALGYVREVVEEFNTLNGKIERVNNIKTELASAMKYAKQYNFNGEVKGMEYTEEEAKQLLNSYKELHQYISNPSVDKSSLEYYEQLISYIKTATKLAASYNAHGFDFSISDKNMRNEFKLAGKEAESYVMGVDSKFGRNIAKSLDSIIANIESRMNGLNLDPSKIKMPEFQNDDQLNYNKKLSSSYDELKNKVQELVQAQAKFDQGLEVDDDGINIEDKIDDLNDYFIALDKTGTKEKEISQILENLSFGDIDENTALTQLCSALQIEIPQAAEIATNSVTQLGSAINNTISGVQTTGSVGDGIQQIGNAAEQAENQVESLHNALKEVFIKASQHSIEVSKGTAIGKEHMNLFDGSGLVSTTQGTGYQVDTSALVNQLMASLKQSVVMSLHDHPDNMDVFSPSDVKSFANLFYGQGTKIHGIIADGFIKTIDFTGITQEVAQKIATTYAENLQDMSKQYSSLFTFEDGTINLSELMKKVQVEQPKQFSQLMGMINDAINGALNDAFIQNGVESTLNVFDVSTLQDLAKYLVEVQQSGQNALSPIEKLQNLITTLNPGKEFNWDNYTEIFEKFSSGAIDGTQAMNQILNLDTVASRIDQAKAKLESFFALTNEIQNQNLFGSAENNVEIGKYTERLETARAELEGLGAQGLITAGDLEKVNQAFEESKSHLEGETSYYDSFYSGGSYSTDYYDDYRDEQYKNAQLKEENDDLREQLAKQSESTSNLALYEDTDGQLALFDNVSASAQQATNNVEELESAVKRIDDLDGQTSLFDDNGDVQKQNDALKEQLSLMDQLKSKATQYSDARSFMRENVSDLKDAGVKDAKSAKAFWRDANYNREDFQPVAMAMDDVANIIRTKVPDSILDGWFRNADSTYKSKLENLALTDTDIRNAALNVMWENYKQYSGKDIGYDEFLHSDIPVYRGKNSEKYVDGDELLSFTFDRSMAEKFGNHVFEAMIKPIDTIGAYQTTAESEILVRRDQLEAMSGFSKWLSNMSSDLNKSFVQANVDADNLSTINQENDALREQANLKEQINATDAADTSNVPTIEAENAALREQAALQDKINDGQDVETKQKKTSKKTAEEIGAKNAYKQEYDKALKNYRGQLNSEIKKLDFTTLDENLTPQQQEIADIYKDTILQIETYIKAVQKGQQVETTGIQKSIEALKEKTKLYREQNNLTETGKKKTDAKGKNFGSSVEVRETARFRKLNELAQDPLSGYSTSTAFMETFQKYEIAYSRLIAKKKEFEATGNVTTEDEIQFKQLTDECTEYAKALEKAIAASEKLEQGGSHATPLGEDFIDTNTGRKKALTDFVKQMHDVNAASLTFDKNFTKCMFTVKNSDGTFTKMTAQVDAFKNQIVETTGVTKRSTTVIEGFFNDLKSKASSILTYVISITGIEEVFQQVRQGIEYVKEIDSALTELKKVTNESDASYDSFLQSMSKTAGVVGSTVSELTTMAAEWARLGYTMEEAGKLAESTAILLNVSEFEDATTASEALISTMQAFQYTADESQHVVDILNEVGNNYAVSSDGIAVALQDSASALMEAGNNLEQSVALVAAAMKNWLFI